MNQHIPASIAGHPAPSDSKIHGSYRQFNQGKTSVQLLTAKNFPETKPDVIDASTPKKAEAAPSSAPKRSKSRQRISLEAEVNDLLQNLGMELAVSPPRQDAQSATVSKEAASADSAGARVSEVAKNTKKSNSHATMKDGNAESLPLKKPAPPESSVIAKTSISLPQDVSQKTVPAQTDTQSVSLRTSAATTTPSSAEGKTIARDAQMLANLNDADLTELRDNLRQMKDLFASSTEQRPSSSMQVPNSPEKRSSEAATSAQSSFPAASPRHDWYPREMDALRPNILPLPLSNPKPEAKPEAKLDAKLDAKPEAKLDAKPEAKLDAKPEAKLDAKPEAKLD
ncbi:MAG: hypothetical protein RL095_1114, partial [Verrucomicrobiota bacterium]